MEKVKKKNSDIIEPQKENSEEKETAEETKSALLGSIKEYGTNSYYYAHAPKDFDVGSGKRLEGSGLIHGGEPVPVELPKPVGTSSKKSIPQKITKYYWDDQKKKVKVYIDLTQELFNGNITEDMIDMDLDQTSLNIKIADDKSNMYEFSIKKLYDKIEPDKSKIIVTKDKIKVHLHKWIETKWKELSAKK